jgi:ATP-dependent helicase/nuclease subunit B
MDSQRELEVVVQAAISGATVLTGNTRASRFLLTECDKVLERSADAWQTPDILPLSTWVQRSFRDAQIAGATELVLLNRRQSQSLWKQSISESGAMAELFRPTSASGSALEAWAQIHAYRIPINSSFEITSQVKAFAGWAKRYRSVLARNNWTDDARVADELLALVKAGKTSLPKTIHLWGCGDLTPQMAELFAAVQDTGTAVVTHEFAETSWEHTRRLAFNDSAAELRSAAAFARQVLRSNPTARIGVVIPRLREHRIKAEAIFMETLHPEFYVGEQGPRAFELSLGSSLASYELISTALKLLRFSVEDLKFSELRELLMSPYLAGAESESGERARLCHWLGEHASEQMSAQRLVKLLSPAQHSSKDAERLSRIAIPRLRRILAKISRPEGLPTRGGMSDWATLLGRLLRETGWPGGADTELTSRNFQAYTKWLELLSGLASLDLTQGPMSLREAVQEIIHAAGAQTFAPENRGAPVQIMDVHEASGSLFDHLWVCGLNDETWPPRRSGSAFIPSQLARAAKVPGSTPESQAEEAQKEMACLLSSSPQVLLSYPLMEAERKLRVSPAIKSAAIIEWAALGIEEVPTWFERMTAGACEELTDVNAPAMTESDLMHRGTSLVERQAACPFKAFAELRLGAVKAEEPAGGIEPKRRGNLIEDVLQAFWLEARDLRNLEGISAEDRKRLIDRAVDLALKKELRGMETSAEIAMREIERERLINLATEWLELELLRDPFDQVRHQQDFEYMVAGVRLKGRIDRIDRSVTHLGEVILDYKAGAASNYKRKSWEAPRPKAPQLPIYAAYLQSQGREVVGVGFAILNTAKSEVEGIATSNEVFGCSSKLPKWAKPTLREQIDAWAAEIEKLVREHLEGAAQVDPKTPPSSSGSTCQHCHLHAMCRVSEAVIADGDGEGDGDE